MYFFRRIPCKGGSGGANNKYSKDKEAPYAPEPEPLVEIDQASPVGYRVAQIPGTLAAYGTSYIR